MGAPAPLRRSVTAETAEIGPPSEKNPGAHRARLQDFKENDSVLHDSVESSSSAIRHPPSAVIDSRYSGSALALDAGPSPRLLRSPFPSVTIRAEIRS